MAVTREYKKHLLAVIEEGAANKPRNLQRRIGPSGIGNPCYKCLGYALAEVPQRPGDSQWLPFIGTAVHAELEKIFEAHNVRHDGDLWMTEQTVTVGHIGDKEITGSADLYDLRAHNSIDWKIVGDRTLTAARKGQAGQTYRVQGHTYCRGHELAGRTPKNVIIAFLPRNAQSIHEAVILDEEYDPAIAAEALRKANDIQALGDKHGWHEVLSRLKSYAECWDCKKGRNYTPDEARMIGYIA